MNPLEMVAYSARRFIDGILSIHKVASYHVPNGFSGFVFFFGAFDRSFIAQELRSE